MSWSLKDRHFVGVGAAVCAVCCAGLLLALLGIAGAAATVAAFVFAGAVFAAAADAGALVAMWRHRRHSNSTEPGAPNNGAVDLAVTTGQRAEIR